MAKRGGVIQALGNLWRWTVWGLAAILVGVLWMAWSNRATGPENDVVAGAEAPVEEAVEDAPDAGEAVADVTTPASVAQESGTAVEDASEAANAVTENTVAEAQSAPEVGPGAQDGQATEQEEVAAAGDAVSQEEADLNILPPELSNITIPGDAARYALVSVFQRDDGTIEVVSDRTENGATVRTIRLVTCAPLAVGVISDAGGIRNEAPEMERIPLGNATATIAALACGAMN